MAYCTQEGNRREFGDEFSGRIYRVEWKCAACGEWESEEEVVWIDPQTGEATTSDRGSPFHVDCAPEEKE